jgi:hypothetical protein
MLIKIKQDNMKPLKQMQVDPLTGMPVIAPGVQDPMPARSSELYEGADPGYAQGSMETAMKANPMMAGLGQYGLKQKEEFDPAKADRNNDGKVSDWEKASVKSFTK